MKVKRYDPDTGAVLSTDLTSVDFGTVVLGKHIHNAVVVQPYSETETISRIELFLEDRDIFANCAFKGFKSPTFIPGIQTSDIRLSDNLYLSHGASDFVLSNNGIPLNSIGYGENGDYVWLDALVGTSQTPGSGTINYRFVFEYN